MPSTVIQSFSYDSESQILRVCFLSGNVYHYHEVPEKLFLRMKRYMSKGTFLNKFVKGKYKYTKVEVDD